MPLNHYVADAIHKLKEVKNYNRWIYDNYRAYIKGKKIFEIGCGIGNMTDYLVQGGHQVTGIDIDPEYVRYSRKKYAGQGNIKILHDDITALKKIKRKNYFESAIILNVIEHIKDDKKVLKNIYKALKKGGVLVILAPAMQLLYGEMDRNFGHVKRYSAGELKTLLKDTGFEPEKAFYMNSIGAFGWYVNSVILKSRQIPHNQAKLFDRMIVPGLKAMESIIKPFFGQSVIAVGIKK